MVSSSTLPFLRVPNTLERGTKSKVAHKWLGAYVTRGGRGFPIIAKEGKQSKLFHKWAWCPCDPCRVKGLQRLGAGNQIRGGAKVGGVAA